jgi:hypothetical protein
MKLRLSLLAGLSLALTAAAQKKPLDHTVYDAWESMGERRISDDGNWVAYVTDLQEGDGWLTVVRADGGDRKVFPRGYAIAFGPDSRQLVFRIRAPYAQTRQARIRKARPDDMPKDSLAILLLGTDSLVRYARVKAYRMPDDDREGWLALHLDKPVADSMTRTKPAARPFPLHSPLQRMRPFLLQASMPRATRLPPPAGKGRTSCCVTSQRASSMYCPP